MTVTADAAVTRSTGPLSLRSGAYFGALVNPVRSDPSNTPAEVSALEGQVGRKLDIVNHFYTYNQAVGTQGEMQDVAGGRIPMVTWGATSTTSINNGSQDAYITAQATRLKNLGGPVILRYFHEPEGAYRSNIIGSTTAYINAWKHARSLFTAAGATNVIWMFTTTAYSFRVRFESAGAGVLSRPRPGRLDRRRRIQLRSRQAGSQVEQLPDGLRQVVRVGGDHAQATDGRRVRRDGGSGDAQSQGDVVRRDAYYGEDRHAADPGRGRVEHHERQGKAIPTTGTSTPRRPR